jgi:hypothetical protein
MEHLTVSATLRPPCGHPATDQSNPDQPRLLIAVGRLGRKLATFANNCFTHQNAIPRSNKKLACENGYYHKLTR